ncbi:MAG: RecQ family ATP-dependent DNA helicase [Paludibacteraceae bacterium]
MSPREVLQTYWHYDNFRPLQAEIIDSVLAGRDTLALMPTGGGKSLCFQVPTMVIANGGSDSSSTAGEASASPAGSGLCLVVTPLIALMKDQVANLRERDILAAAIYTGMSRDQQRAALDNCQFGPYHFLYVSPERLESEAFRKRLTELPICLIAVDEAHCISQWGYDFRPSYLHIADIRESLSGVPVLALTATATPAVVEDIQERLLFREKNILKKSFHRENLQYIVREVSRTSKSPSEGGFSEPATSDGREEKTAQIIHILGKVAGSAIVYVRNRKRAQEVAEALSAHHISADFYHAGLSTKERTLKQEQWKADSTRVMVCTNAFGMGIDKPNVRVVIHHDLPDSLEAYYQEAGRAGRDGKTAYAVLLYHPADRAKARRRVSANYPPKEFVERVYHATCDFLQVGAGSGLNHSFPLHLDELCQRMHLPVLQTYSALHLLDQAGYIHFEEEHETPPRVRINILPTDLVHYSLSREQIRLLDQLMRQYCGIFTDFQYIDDTEHDLLVSLAQRRIITYIPRTVACTFTFIIERQADIFLPPRIYEERQAQYAERLRAMVEYAEQKQFCREQLLLGYFGESDAPPCGHCDVCRGRNKEQ